MSEKKRTFVDPQTGEEMESTRLARLGVGWVFGLSGGFGGGLLAGLNLGLLLGLFEGLSEGLLLRLFEGLLGGLFLGLFLGLLCGLGGGLATALISGLSGMDAVRNDAATQRVHDPIARWQHRCRQRILRRKEFPHVPDTALSRAEQASEPKPTDASLSQAEKAKEEQERLAESVAEKVKSVDEETIVTEETR